MAESIWHLWIDEQPRAGWANMSVDTALLDRADGEGQIWLRLYQWAPHCLSFGRHEPASAAYDVGRIQALGLDTVRRPTGGRAVWHARELTYALAAPWQVFGSLRGAYQDIHRVLAAALAALGLDTSLAPRARTAGLDAGACFSQPVGGEVLASGQKVVGSAQLRRGSAFLQHGSILLDGDQGVVAELRRNPHGKPAARIAQWQTPPAASVVADRVAEAAASFWPGRWERVTAPDPIVRAAATHYAQFRSPTWTWAR